MEYDVFASLMEQMQTVELAERFSQILEEDARRYDRSFSEDREAGKI